MSDQRVVPRSGLVIALALVVVLVGLVGSAFGAVAALQRSEAVTASSSANKSVTASCAAGKRLLGTGADIGGGAGEVVMAGLVPNAGLTSVSVRALEYGNGFTGSWNLGGSALCATPVPGLERVVATSPTDSSNKGVSATCPAGKKLIGTGAEIKGAGGQVALEDLIPTSLTSVTATASEDENGTAATWSVVAYAICANPVVGLQRVVATSATNSNASKAAVANCPAGKRVTGVGGDLKGATGQVVIDDLNPSPNPPFQVQVLGIEDDTGTSANWSVTAYAICANSSRRLDDTSATNSDSSRSVLTDCPTDQQLTGLGGEITGALGEVWLQDLSLANPPFNSGVDAWEDQTGTARNWFIRAYAICATPLPGLESVSAASPSDTFADKEMDVSCPAGKRVLGGAGSITGIAGQVVLAGMAPNPALTVVRAKGSEDQDFTEGTWSVTAAARCANTPPGLQLVKATSESDSEEVKVVTATCPTAKNLIGTGAEISSSVGQVFLDDVRPNAALTNVTVTALEDEDGSIHGWSVTAFAICANP